MTNNQTNTWRWLRRSVGTALVAGGLLCGTGVVARADGTNTVTLTASCDNGQTMTFQIAGSNGAFPSGLRVVDSSSVFTIHQFTVTSPTGVVLFTTKNDAGVANNKALVSCSHTSATTGNIFTWTGFFTPAS
jgi:hypothetical protein